MLELHPNERSVRMQEATVADTFKLDSCLTQHPTCRCILLDTSVAWLVFKATMLIADRHGVVVAVSPKRKGIL